MIKAVDQHLEKDGKRFFYLADTLWSAFTNLDMADWRFYLDTRKAQGFTAVQMNTIRQWDSSIPAAGREPFKLIEKEDGKYAYDFDQPNEAYFANAEKMLEEMVKRDMTPVLVILWGNYVPGTWMQDFVSNETIPFEKVAQYTKYVVSRFKKFHPIWFVSGDVGFVDDGHQNPQLTAKYYREVLKTAKAEDPDDLYTFHINGESTALPEEFMNEIDFFSFQSGHGYPGQNTAYTIPQLLREKGYKGPIIDTETCYEGMTRMEAPEPSRYSAWDVRKAGWRAVLSGVDAGLGYGSFGIWPWTDKARPETVVTSPFEGVAVLLDCFDWRQCLTFQGAKDFGFLKRIILETAPKGLTPVANPVENNPGIRAAESEDYWLIYLPTVDTFDFGQLGIRVEECTVVDLATRQSESGKVVNNKVQLSSAVADELIIVRK